MCRFYISLLIKQQGSVGFLSIMAMILLGVMGAAFISLSSTELNSSVSYRNGVAAQYLAEAGARRAIVELDKNSGWTGIAKENMGAGVTAGYYKVDVAATGNDRTITSTGVVGNATRKVVLKLTLPSSTTTAYNYAISSGSNMNFGNNADINGSVRSNGTININNNVDISQNVTASGSINRGNHIHIGGTITSNAPVQTLPAYNSSDYSNGQAIGNVANNGSLALNGGKYYKSGDWILNNNATVTGNGTIYVTGNVILENNATITGNVMIIAEGDINLQNNSSITKGVLYSKQNINFDNNNFFTGSAVASGTINVNNNATITWDQTVVQFFGVGGGTTQLTINSWGNY